MPHRASRFLVGLCVAACLVAGRTADVWAAEQPSAVAVFPVENLSGVNVPADVIRQVLTERLAASGITVLDDETLDAFVVRHRVRYAAGVDAATAALLHKETGVEGVVIASVGLSSDMVPPKIAMVVRLVSTTGAPTVVWADDAGLSGDDAPGLLDLRMVNDYDELVERALDRLCGSLLDYLATGQARTDVKRAAKFRPRVAYNGVRLEAGKVHSIAVLPFFNVSERRNAGEMLALLFMRHLSSTGAFRVIDTGEVRQQLLQARVIMDGGISVADADLVGTILEADFVLAGRVLAYDDYEGPEGRTHAEFSVVLIERATRRVVWSSHSDNHGSDGVRFFGRGRSTNAQGMATQMVGLATEMIANGRK